MAVLEFRRTSSMPRSGTLLDNVSFSVEKGQLSLCLSAQDRTRLELALILAGLTRPTDGTALIGTRDAWIVEKITQRSVGFIIPGVRYEDEMSLRAIIDEQRSLRHLPHRESDPRIKFNYFKIWGLDPDRTVGDLDEGEFALFQTMLAYEHSPTVYVFVDCYLRADERQGQKISDFIGERISEGATILAIEPAWSETMPLPDLVQVLHEGSVVLDAETLGATELLPVRPGMDLAQEGSLPDDFYTMCIRYQAETARESLAYLDGEGPRRQPPGPPKTRRASKSTAQDKIKHAGGKLKLK